MSQISPHAQAILNEKLRLLRESLDPKIAILKYQDDKFPKQQAFVQDKSRFIAGQCSRRAGKSNGLALRFFSTLDTHPGAFCPYTSLTRESAKNIMWPVLQELDEKYKIGYKFKESNLTATHPNQGRIQLFGADMKNFIKRLKGIKSPGVGIDEAQDFGPHLQSLVDDVFTPAMTDYSDSWLSITGTPGPIPRGYFYDITELRKFGYSLHKWTLLDNPYLPNPSQFIEDLKQKKGWTENHPTLMREWRNKWVLDLESLLIRYNEKTNHYDDLPKANWHYIMGIDLGFKDADAIAILAWSESQPATYLVEELVTHKQGLTELVKQIKKLNEQYQCEKMMIDEGGLGKKLAEEMRRQHHIPVQAADKTRKMESVEFLNDALRLGKFKAKKDSHFVADSYQVQIDWDRSTPSRLVVKEGFHSDIIDAVLYPFKESPAYTYEKPIDKPRVGTKEWAMAQETEMEENAERYFRELEEAQGFYNEEGYS